MDLIREFIKKLDTKLYLPFAVSSVIKKIDINLHGTFTCAIIQFNKKYATILVIGDGAKRISKATGGWTLSWQGNNHTNEEFPNATSIFEGIEEVISKSGGNLFFSEDGYFNQDVDIVIAVYGEDPYAEFQGDRENLDFVSNVFDTNILENYKNREIPVVSVFLSGRPMWTNPEINS